MGSFPETYNDPRRLRFRRSRLNERRIRARFCSFIICVDPYGRGLILTLFITYNITQGLASMICNWPLKGKKLLTNGRVGIVILTYFPPAILFHNTYSSKWKKSHINSSSTLTRNHFFYQPISWGTPRQCQTPSLLASGSARALRNYTVKKS